MAEGRIAVPQELFAPAESFRFSGELHLGTLEAGSDVYTFEGPVAWEVTVTNTGDALLVMGTAEGVAATACARCLEDYEEQLSGEIEGYFLLGVDSAVPEGMDEDEYEVLPESHEIEVRPLVVAALLLELPLVPLCSDDCAGLCPQCGANLNEGPCACDAERTAAENAAFEESENPFSVLKGLNFD